MLPKKFCSIGSICGVRCNILTTRRSALPESQRPISSIKIAASAFSVLLTMSGSSSPIGSGYAQIHDLNLNAFTQREGGSQLTLHKGVQAGSLRFRVRQAKLKWNPRSAPWLDTHPKPVGSGYAQIHDLNLNAFTQREGGSQLTLHKGVQAGSLRFRVRQAKLKWNPRSA